MTDDLEFSLDRHYPHSPEVVWQHLVAAERMATWFCPNPALETRCELDVRPGGRWRCAMGPFAVGGEYVTVDAPRQIAFTWDWEHDDDPATTVVITLAPDGDGTRLVLRHTELTPDVGEDGHESGWTITLSRLAEALTPPVS